MCPCDKKSDYACLSCRNAILRDVKAGWDVATVRARHSEWKCELVGVR